MRSGVAWLAVQAGPGATHCRSRLRSLVRAAPFAVVYVAAAWTLAVVLTRPEPGEGGLFALNLPDLRDALPDALVSLLWAPLFNPGVQQILYVTVLMCTFGVVVERREGTRRAVLLFYGTSAIGAAGAGIVLHAVYPGVIDNSVTEGAWERAWSGGSAGCFGLLGAWAARSSRPWLALVAIALWEVNVAFWWLQNYTPVFHGFALAGGFAITRYLLPYVPDAAMIPEDPACEQGGV